MENKKLIEKILFCLGMMLLFIGLWQYIDFSLINKYTILGASIVASIVTYFIAKRDLFRSSSISNVFTLISLGLSMTSIYMVYYVYRLVALDWLILVLVGITILSFLIEFNNRIIYFIAAIYMIKASVATMGYDVVKMLVVMLFLYCLSVIFIHRNNVFNVKDWLVPVSITFFQTNLTIYSIYKVLDEVFKIENDTAFYVAIISIIILACILCFTRANSIIGVGKTFQVIFFILFFLMTSVDFVDAFSFKLMTVITIVTVFTILSLSIHIKNAMCGKTISVVLIVIQFIITSSNILKFASFAVFAIFIGVALIGVAIFINKRQ